MQNNGKKTTTTTATNITRVEDAGSAAQAPSRRVAALHTLPLPAAERPTHARAVVALLVATRVCVSLTPSPALLCVCVRVYGTYVCVWAMRA